MTDGNTDPKDMTQLVERLVQHGRDLADNGYSNASGPLYEAADAITTLLEEVGRYREALKRAAWELTDKGLDREAAAARAALQGSIILGN